MLQRVAIQFLLIFLFAFTQIGVATHEISHFSDNKKHQQQDKNTAAEQCGQCIAYAQVASGLQPQVFVLHAFETRFEFNSSSRSNLQPSLLTAYTARAPPQNISI